MFGPVGRIDVVAGGRWIQDILDTYLKNINKSEQPGVWVSGFFGSGKSHMVKMLRAFWLNTKFPDGATAREVAKLPQAIKDHLVDLTNAVEIPPVERFTAQPSNEYSILLSANLL